MKAQSFVNKSECTKIAKKMRQFAKLGGLDDLNTCSDKIIVSAEQCELVADCFDSAREEGGKYFCNIINEPFFSRIEIEVILQHI